MKMKPLDDSKDIQTSPFELPERIGNDIVLKLDNVNEILKIAKGNMDTISDTLNRMFLTPLGVKWRQEGQTFVQSNEDQSLHKEFQQGVEQTLNNAAKLGMVISVDMKTAMFLVLLLVFGLFVSSIMPPFLGKRLATYGNQTAVYDINNSLLETFGTRTYTPFTTTPEPLVQPIPNYTRGDLFDLIGPPTANNSNTTLLLDRNESATPQANQPGNIAQVGPKSEAMKTVLGQLFGPNWASPPNLQ